MKTKILYLITKATTGGAQRYVYDLVTNLPKEQFDSIVAYGTEGELARKLSAAGIKLRRISSLERDIALVSDILSFFEMLRLFKELHPDVIHLNSSKAAGLGALAGRIARVPKIVFTVHGWPFKEDRNVIARSIIYLVSYLSALLSHKVIVVSKTDEKLGTRMWGVVKNVCYIPLGLASFTTLPPPQGFKAMFGSSPPPTLRDSTIRLVTIAELTRNKGIRYAIEAVAELSKRDMDAIYVIAGTGEGRAALETYATGLGVEDRVFFAGFVENAAHNLAGFDVFVLPSLKEGTPYVLLEASRAGIPIVATTAVDAELIQQLGNAHVVPPRDARAIADAIVECSKLPRREYDRSESFSLPEMVQKTAELYRL